MTCYERTLSGRIPTEIGHCYAVWNLQTFQMVVGRAISQRSFAAVTRDVPRPPLPFRRPGSHRLRCASGAAHDARQRSPEHPARQVGGSRPVEMIIGIALIVIAALEIWFIVRTVQANMGRA